MLFAIHLLFGQNYILVLAIELKTPEGTIQLFHRSN